MTYERLHTIGTTGACGLIALALLRRLGGVALLRYEDGAAVHAAMRTAGGEVIDLGCRGGLVPVTEEELRRACREDFDPSRVCLERGELRAAVELLIAK